MDWETVLPLTIGMFAGSLIGPRLARRIPAGVLRWLVALLGIGLAIKLWLDPHRHVRHDPVQHTSTAPTLALARQAIGHQPPSSAASRP